MSKNADFWGLPTDNSSSTNLKYDIIASKMMTGMENHYRRQSVSSPLTSFVSLGGLILQGVIGLLIVTFLVIKRIFR